MVIASLSLCFVLLGATDAEILLQEGFQLRKERQDAEALAKFQQAYKLSRRSDALAQVALAEQALGRWVAAEVHLKRALRNRKSAWIDRHRGELRRALEKIQQRLGTVEIGVSVDGARVRINQRNIGLTPIKRRVRVAAGTVVISIEAPGYWPMTRRTDVSGGETAREWIELIKKTELTETQSTTTLPAAPQPTPKAYAERPSTPSLAPYAYASGLTSVAAAGAGAVLLLIRNRHAIDLRECLRDGGGEMCEGEETAGKRAETGMIAAFAGAGALAILSTVLFVVDADEKDELTRTDDAQGCGPGPGLFGIACAVSF